MHIRPATPADAAAIAALHTDSWQRTYRGVLSDDYLDHQATPERLAYWQARLREPAATQRVLLLEDETGALLGFACVVLDEDPRWGNYLNNLHVRHDQQGLGLGRRLMQASAAACAEARAPGLYLGVLHANVAAQRFYARLGGREAGSEIWAAPDGSRPPYYRYVWEQMQDLTPAP